MSRKEPRTRVARIKEWAENQPVLAVLIVVVLAIGGIAASFNAVSDLLGKWRSREPSEGVNMTILLGMTFKQAAEIAVEVDSSALRIDPKCAPDLLAAPLSPGGIHASTTEDLLRALGYRIAARAASRPYQVSHFKEISVYEISCGT